MLLFLDFDGVLHPLAEPVEGGRGRAYEGPPLVYVQDLIDALGRHLACIDIAVSSSWGRTRTLDDLRALLPSAVAAQVVGSVWDAPQPRLMTRYEHIRYWLARTYVGRPPMWFALDDDDRGWPTEQRDRLIHCPETIHATRVQNDLKARLERYVWPDLWWGEGESPSKADIRRAFSLTLDWQVRGPERVGLLGTTRAEFQTRLDILLSIYAAPPPRESKLTWPWQWLWFPCSALHGERPLEVMTTQGTDGMKRVRAVAWALGSPGGAHLDE